MADSKSSMSSMISVANAKWVFTNAQLWTATVMLFGAFVAYNELATKSYVNAKHDDVTAKIDALTNAQAESAKQIGALADQNSKTNKRMGLVVRLVSAQYIDSVDDDERDSQPNRRRSGGRSQRSHKANTIARALKVDPDDPLAGIELTEVLDDGP